jgi:hypothetical protein
MAPDVPSVASEHHPHKEEPKMGRIPSRARRIAAVAVIAGLTVPGIAVAAGSTSATTAAAPATAAKVKPRDVRGPGDKLDRARKDVRTPGDKLDHVAKDVRGPGDPAR